MPTYDTWGKDDLIHVLSLFETEILDKKLLKVYTLPFYTTYSFVIIEKESSRKCVLDLFLDLLVESRHTIILEDTKENPSFLIDACIEQKDRYIKLAKEQDLTKSIYSKKIELR